MHAIARKNLGNSNTAFQSSAAEIKSARTTATVFDTIAEVLGCCRNYAEIVDFMTCCLVFRITRFRSASAKGSHIFVVRENICSLRLNLIPLKYQSQIK